MNDILKYVNNYFKTNTGKSSALQYLDYTSIIIIILSLAIVGLIIWLMKYKNKPRLVYWLYIIVYLVTIAILLISFNELNAIFTANDTARGLRAVIDITRISIWCQYYLIAYMLIRGLGFDIKRFNFKRDLEELQIENNDNEEVEVTFGGNTETLKRKGRRSIRELKYYYIENKYIINILIILIIVGVVFFIITDRTITNVVYNKGDTAQSGIYNIKLINSYITNQSSSGKTILDNEYKLVVVKFAINNTSTNNTQINTDYLVLDVDGNQITATNKYNNYLSDLGTIYKKQYITNNIKYFILVYKVNQSDIKKNMKFLYLGNYNNGSNLTFNLNPVTLDNNKLKQSVNLNAELKFNDSLLNNTTLKITQYEIQNKYEYNYCYKEDCSYTATIDSLDNNIIKMDIESSIDESIDLEKNWNDIINNYMNIYYVIDDITYNSLICYSKTPSELDNVIYLEVDKNIEKASKIWLEFNIRNTIYKYTIKES
jgi:hypothetical protein